MKTGVAGTLVVLLILTVAPLHAQCEKPVTGSDCPDCEQGEWRVCQEKTTPDGDYIRRGEPVCSPGFTERTNSIVQTALNNATTSIPFVGPLILAAEKGIVKGLANTGGAIAGFLVEDRFAACSKFAITMPAKFVITKHTIEARSRQDRELQPCDQFNGACKIGWSMWEAYKDTPGSYLKVISYTFKNSASKSHRVARFTLYFKPPSGWTPQ